MGVRLAALVPILGLLLAGCTSSAEEPLPQPPAFSATPTPTAVVAEVPPSARATDAVGAAQFARLYVEVLEKAYASGEVAQLQELADATCNTCAEFARAITSSRKQGLTLSGGEFTIRAAEATESKPGDAIVDVLYDRTAAQRKDARGTVVDTAPASQRVLMQLRVVRTDQWRVFGVRYPDTPS